MSGQQTDAVRVSGRAARIPPFLAMEVFERALQLEREGRSIVHLEVGEPDWDTPAVAVETGIEALRRGCTRYTHSLGHPELREAIADWYRRRYRVDVSADRVAVTVGSSGAMLLVLAALLDPGSEVLMSDPHYACYPKFVSTLEGVPVMVPVSEREGFQLASHRVRERLGPRARVLILNSPANPTGAVIEAGLMGRLAEALEGRVTIVSDEIYHGLEYGVESHSILEFSPEAVVVSGFSKLFAMTGWRLGFAILPRALVRPVQKLQQNLFISAPDFAQHAAVAALGVGIQEIDRRRLQCDERRRLVLNRLGEMGLPVPVEPRGAFYVFVSIQDQGGDSGQFAGRLLEEAGVAVTPGVDFGAGGEGFIRISYASSLANLEEGMRRLGSFLGRSRRP